MYRIKIDYTTGDSFHTEETFTYLEGTFKNMETVEENIERIKNHYEYYQKYDDMWKKPAEKTPKGVIWDKEWRAITLETVDDDGNLFTTMPDWMGYFETLNELSVETDTPRWRPH